MRQRVSTSFSRRGEGGSSTIELVIIAPMLLLLLMLAIQFAMVAHAQSGAQMAADEGAARARAYDGSAGAGKTQAERYVSELIGQMFTSHAISGNRNAAEASITVSGTVKSLVPGVHPRVTRTSTGPVERFVKEGS